MKNGVLFCILSAWAGWVLADAAPSAVETATGQDDSMARQCSLAYRRQDLHFVLAHCPEEAWALARAQCERQADSVAPAYVEFCSRFYDGTAPSYGH
ncbi:MAG TPA: hypothetical protein VF811_06880 [Parasulfuritortus sp.]